MKSVRDQIIKLINENTPPDGPFEKFYPNGLLQSKGTRLNGWCIGSYQHNYQNGIIREKGVINDKHDFVGLWVENRTFFNKIIYTKTYYIQ